LVSECSARLGLNIHRGKSKVFKIHAANANTIMLKGGKSEEVDSFLYLGSIIDKQGGREAEKRARMGKAKVVFNQLSNVWKSTDIKRKKNRIFNTMVRPVLY
jgi:hypothetical protein